MKRVVLACLAAVLALGLGMGPAEAKRLGSGKSFGMQREATPQRADAPPARSVDAPAAPASPMAPAAAQPRKNSWLGPVAGLVAGLGLAALASHFGFGEELASFMLIALLAMVALVVFRMFLRKRSAEPGLQYAGAGDGPLSPGFGRPEAVPGAGYAASSGAATPAESGERARMPAGFDAEGFLRQAKLNFVRLQAANDEGNLADLREFTSPEVFAELQLQISERGGVPQRTEVMDLQAAMVECVEEGARYIASVRFGGLLREDAQAGPERFEEIWHLTKPADGSRGWVVAGIQQIV